ncbi:hypothetical protein IV203_029220 [Nitzschia inconspicua]|uniref:Uncharacterized protein n=1 Tax=Nitzschia inconspicua TaxID=303405 RepID=A0A9K3Q108_9STRA|nr:hypothetical protein IV203_029220 [Nitzschia inconspicua]
MTRCELDQDKHEQQPGHDERCSGFIKPSSTGFVASLSNNLHGWSTPRMDIKAESSMLQSMFRSVSMTQPPTTSTTRFSMKDDTMKTYPAIAPLHKKSPPYHKAQSSPGFIHSPPPSTPAWKVRALQSLPMYYPLESNAITIQRSLCSLTEQISAFLKEHSVCSVYHDDAGRVDCMTSGLLRFSVQLWKDNRASSVAESSPSIIIEIQRRQGCCIEMQRMRQELIERLMNPKTGLSTLPVPSPRSTPVHVLQQLVEQSASVNGTTAVPALTMTDCDSAYQISCRLLKSDRLDERRLGLESLHLIANARNVMMHQAHLVSSKILTDPYLQSLLLDYFAGIEVNSDGENDNDSMELDDHDGTLDYQRGRYFGDMHILALKTISNALDTAVYCNKDKREDNFDVGSLNLASPFWNHALQAMLYDMHYSHVRPLEACLSVRSLRRLHSLTRHALNERLTMFADSVQLDHFLSDARSFGQMHHSQLEHETVQFMNQLGLVC